MAFYFCSFSTNMLHASMMAVPRITMAELMAVAYSGDVYVTIATPAVWRAPTMPLTSPNIFLFIIFTFLVINMHLSRIFAVWVYFFLIFI